MYPSFIFVGSVNQLLAEADFKLEDLLLSFVGCCQNITQIHGLCCSTGILASINMQLKPFVVGAGFGCIQTPLQWKSWTNEVSRTGKFAVRTPQLENGT